MKIKDRILILLEEKEICPSKMTDLLEVSKQAIHIAINQLLEEETIIKFGKVPKSIYRLQSQKKLHPKKKTPEISAQTVTIWTSIFGYHRSWRNDGRCGRFYSLGKPEKTAS